MRHAPISLSFVFDFPLFSPIFELELIFRFLYVEMDREAHVKSRKPEQLVDDQDTVNYGI